LNDLSLPSRFLKVTRNFGLAIAVKVTYSKIRGMLRPALALPDGRIYADNRRQVSLLIDAAEHDADTLNSTVEAVAANHRDGWEICICERPPVEPQVARLLERLRGTQPWIRIVTAGSAVDGATSARWIVEQATGQFIALVAPRCVADAEEIRRLLDRMHRDPKTDAAAFVGIQSAPEQPSLPAVGVSCRLAVQRKAGYLASQPERWPLTAPALARQLQEAKVRTAYIRAD
jgi:hypothetical protein